MEKIELKVNTREVLGKKVRALRREGIIPVHLFGNDVTPTPLQCDALDLKHVLAKAGKTHLVDLKVDKAKKAAKAVVREIQRDPVKGSLLHVDFYQVRMTDKIKVDVPITLVGEAPALKIKGNMLIRELDKLTIECLPDDIPDHIELDVSILDESVHAIHVSEIAPIDGVTFITDLEHDVVRIGTVRTTAEDEAEDAAEAEAAEAVEGAEGAAAEAPADQA
ncbi:MAG: 50S ribosomal protein L25 [Chloroflexi bacterium]|jgi:large subunit ribosomal protein L25|nr:50S ribosomal protein L25 [Chloroflexota bacterium]MBT7081253.1 50S ribosomal protein L25 [Chloroflexota bacterium]MBT7288912.1 50S ribosomal protein L25 [Chloroflexota bacterium]